jgi:hypothetical protein
MTGGMGVWQYFEHGIMCLYINQLKLEGAFSSALPALHILQNKSSILSGVAFEVQQPLTTLFLIAITVVACQINELRDGTRKIVIVWSFSTVICYKVKFRQCYQQNDTNQIPWKNESQAAA